MVLLGEEIDSRPYVIYVFTVSVQRNRFAATSDL